MFNKLKNWLMYHLICKRKGHNFEIYKYKTGYWSYDIEMAGHCKRCNFDTHE